MKKLRYAYLGLCLALVTGVMGPGYLVFAEEMTPITDYLEVEDESEEDDPEEVDEEDSDSLEPTTENPEDSEDEENDFISEEIKENVFIKSFNPGFSSEGEFFELLKLSKNNISLAGLTVLYVTSSGREYVVYDFPETSEMVGESLLMRLASSDEVAGVEDYHEVADATYTRNMSRSKGRIKLVYEEETIDTLCWGLDDDDCFSGFNANKPTTLVRDLSAEEVEDSFVHTANYVPTYDPENPGLVFHEVPEEVVESKCKSLEFSEILTYFENSNTEQFIELFNRSEERVEMTGCFIRYKNKNYALSGEIGANSFRAIYNIAEWGLSLTKNPTSSNSLEIIDTTGETVDKLVYSSGQKKGVSLAMIGFSADGTERWVQTYNITPNAENIYQQFKTCPIGKVINLETGNCVNETSLTSTLAACPEGKYRNPLTGRCKSYATTASAELKPCAEGYERNPDTGRCRKIRNNDGADYALEPETFEEKSEFVAIWAIIIVIVVGILYIIFQYREEIAGLFKKKKE